MRDIRAFARRVAAEYEAERIILFGSYAYGQPTQDSDVDIMVVTARRGDPTDLAVDMRNRLRPGFPLDLLVYKPGELRRRLAMKDVLVQEIVQRGKTIYGR